MHTPLSQDEERIASLVVDSAFKVHSTLGPSLLEHIYEVCFCHELGKRGLSVERQVSFPVTYDGKTFEDAYRLDVLVEKRVVCELKAVETILPVYRAQLLSYLKLSGFRLGFLINFNIPLIKNGISRIIS